MGNEESREMPKDQQPAATTIHATSHYQPPNTNQNSQYSTVPLAAGANVNQQQTHPPGWVMPQQPNNPNILSSQNKIYPNLPSSSYNTMQQQQMPNHKPIQTPLTVPPSAPPMFYPQPPTQPNQFYAQPSVGASTTTVQSQSSPVPWNNQSPSNAFNASIWMRATTKSIPENAFRAGRDTDGSVIYICRIPHDGDLMPGKAIQSHNCAYICHAGKEIGKPDFEVLIGDQYRWVPASNGHIPANPVEGGRTVNGEKLFIGRASHNYSLTPGKIHPSHGCLYIPYDGQEFSFKEYEVLVHSTYGVH